MVLTIKCCPSSPSNMPHLVYFIPALFLLLCLTLSPHRQQTFLFLLLYPPMTLPSHCESTSTPEALKSHQALLHLSLCFSHFDSLYCSCPLSGASQLCGHFPLGSTHVSISETIPLFGAMLQTSRS